MKKVITLLFAYSVLFTVYAQSHADAVLQGNLSGSQNLSASDSTNSASYIAADNMTPVKKGFAIMPAAASNNIKLIYTSLKIESAVITVFNSDGKKVLTQNAQLTVGKNNIIVNNFSSLSEGNYAVALTSNGNTFTSSFIVWK